MSKPPDDRATAALIATLSPAEQAALPSRLRALTADERTVAWNAAKAERDAAIAAATALVDPEDPESGYAIEDPLERHAAVTAAKDAWSAFKTAFAAEG